MNRYTSRNPLEDTGDNANTDGLVCDGSRSVDVGNPAGGDGRIIPASIATFRRRSHSNEGGMGRHDSIGGGYAREERDCDGEVEAPRRSIVLLLTDGLRTFRGSIRSEDVKVRHAASKEGVSRDGTTKAGAGAVCGDGYELGLAAVRSFLLTDSHPDVSVSYEVIGDDISVSIKEKLDSGLIRLVWSGHLMDTSAGRQFGEDITGGSSALPFVSAVGSSLCSALGDISRLRGEVTRLRSDVKAWKDTAEKLEGVWQGEKDELLDRFLVLLNRVKGDLRDTRKELEEERKKKEIEIRQMVPGALGTVDGTPVLDTGEGQDYEKYSRSDVDCYAKGIKLPKRRRQNDTKTAGYPEDGDSKPAASVRPDERPQKYSGTVTKEQQSFSQEQDRESQSNMRLNGITGVVEVWNQSVESLYVGDSQEMQGVSRTDSAGKEVMRQDGDASSTAMVPSEKKRNRKGDDRAISTKTSGTEKPGRKKSGRRKPAPLYSDSSTDDSVGLRVRKPTRKLRDSNLAKATTQKGGATGVKKTGVKRDYSWADKLLDSD